MSRMLLILLATVLLCAISFVGECLRPTNWPITIHAPIGWVTINGDTGLVEVSGGWDVVWY